VPTTASFTVVSSRLDAPCASGRGLKVALELALAEIGSTVVDGQGSEEQQHQETGWHQRQNAPPFVPGLPAEALGEDPHETRHAVTAQHVADPGRPDR
jgi:hypothetical protein